MGETIEASQRRGRFCVIAEDRRVRILRSAIGMHVAFGKSVLIAAGRNEYLVVGMCVNANVTAGFDARMGQDSVAAAAEVRRWTSLRLKGPLSVDRGAHGESK